MFDPDTSNLLPVKKLVPHPGFDPVTLKNDLGVVILEDRVCSHDSGSVQLLPGTNTSVGVTTNGFGCVATGGAFRLDTPVARSFLDDFVTLPQLPGSGAPYRGGPRI